AAIRELPSTAIPAAPRSHARRCHPRLARAVENFAPATWLPLHRLPRGCPMTTRQRRHRPEDALQRAIVEHYRQRAAPGVFMFAVPNGGFRRPVEAAILKATGTVAGIPDTIWIKGGQVYALELKAPGGRLTPAQEEVLVKLRECGARACHVHGLDQALASLAP